MDRTKVLTSDKIPDFIYYFLSSKYVANWLGVRIPQMDEIREFVIQNALNIDSRFVNIVFAEYQLKEIENNLDDRIKVEDVGDFVSYVLEYFDDLEDFFAEREEVFYLELIFQLPFIWNSSFNKEEKERFLTGEKTKYYSTFRQNYTGSFVIVRTLEDIIDIFDENECFVSFPFEENFDLEIYLIFPNFLKDYWVSVIEKIVKLSGYLISFEISDC